MVALSALVSLLRPVKGLYKLAFLCTANTFKL